MAQVWEQRFAEAVRRLGALRESTALELLPDLMPVLPVLNAAAPELALLRRERLASGFAANSASVGNFGVCAVSNPAGSRVLMCIDEVWVWGTANVNVSWGIFLAASGLTLGARSHLDTRGITLATVPPSGEVRGDVAAGIPAGLNAGRLSLPASASQARLPGPFILAPDSSLVAASNTANNFFMLHAIWRERVVDPAELNPTGA
jgi:hypothetical protein